MPSTDIFNKTARNVVGGFSVDKAKLTFTGATGLDASSGLLVQNIQIQYTQQVSFVYDLAKADDVYYVAGRTSGTMALGKVVGEKGLVTSFYNAYGDVCQVKGKTIELSGIAGCTPTTPAGGSTAESTNFGTGTITIREPVIVQFGLTMRIEEAVIGENVQLIFATLLLP